MAVTFAAGLRACCAGVALWAATVRAAESPPALIGATRDQVLTRYGEPKSQIAAGNRVVFFYPRERIVLRDGVVVEVEAIAADSSRRPPAAATPGTTSAAPPAAPESGNPATAATESTPGGTVPAASTETAPSAPPPPAPEPKLEIKLVRPPGATRSQPATPPGQMPSTAGAPATAKEIAPPTSGVSAINTVALAPVPQSESTPASAASAGESVTGGSTPDAASTVRPEEVAEADAKEKKAKATKAARRRLDEAVIADPVEDLFTGRSYLIAMVILVGGVGYLVWRARQRQLELAATSVSNTPLSTAGAPAMRDEAVFTASQLAQLDRNRFEELVAAYYAKTGVVAVRTKAEVARPVHIKISWKGEPRPFAYVQCLAHPAGLVETQPLQDLLAALAADDIRRGYIVTTGRFSVGARDLAEEKQITLLPGDIFLEKLNALPAAARMEIMQVVRAGE